ncbi:MAG: sulfatase, partial [Myxococcales bacterium]|nr:sulfatase [Myxococcales bacterium]
MVLLPLLGCGSVAPAPSDEPVVLEAEPAPPRPPDVLILLWDTVRADHLSLYGYDRPTTPRLDAFAREAAVYERAISSSMWTVPAHGSLFTGLPASSHGARVGWLWLDGAHVTLPEHLADHGYATWAWSTNPYLSEQTNLLQGFETVRYAWREPDAEACGAATSAKLIAGDRSSELSPGWSGSQGWPEHLVAYKDCAPHAVDAFLEWQGALPEDRPYLAYVNLLEAHHPRVPSAASRAAVAPSEVVERSLATDASLLRLMSAMEGHDTLDDEEREAVVATYDATLRDLDDATGRLLDGLRDRGVLDRTVVIVVSDHGENLGERGMWDHRWDLHQPLVHVPLIVRYPPSVVAGRHLDAVSTANLFG